MLKVNPNDIYSYIFNRIFLFKFLVFYREPQWNKDESVFARSVSNEVHFYKSNDLQTIAHKKVLPKVRSFSLSPSVDNHYVTFFVPSKFQQIF